MLSKDQEFLREKLWEVVFFLPKVIAGVLMGLAGLAIWGKPGDEISIHGCGSLDDPCKAAIVMGLVFSIIILIWWRVICWLLRGLPNNNHSIPTKRELRWLFYAGVLVFAVLYLIVAILPSSGSTTILW